MDDCPEGKVEKTAIVLEDDEAAIVLDEHGRNDCQGEDMSYDEIPINIELGEHGLYYGTSPQMKGLLVTGDSIEQVMKRVPVAIAEMRAVAEISKLKADLEEAKGIIATAHDYLSCDWFPHKSRNGNDKAAIEARARSFLKRTDKENGDG